MSGTFLQTVVTPEGTERESKKRKGSRLPLVVVAMAFGVLGIIVFSALTTPDPEAISETTTTSTTIDELTTPIDVENFSVSQIAKGTPFAWRHSFTIEDTTAGNLINHRGQVYLFTSEATSGFGSRPAELPGSVYVYNPGSGWELVGDLPEGLPAHTIASTFSGFMGVASGVNGEPATLYISPEGVTWDAMALPEISDSPFATTWAQPPAATKTTTVVGLIADIDLTSVVADHYEATFGVAPNLRNFWPSTQFNGEETTVVVHGPLGINLWEFPAAEIGLTESERVALDGGYVSRVLAGVPGGDWVRTDPDVEWIDSIVSGGDGSISIFGHPQVGGRVRWLSYDGVNWERDSAPFTPYSGVAWSGGLAGVYDGAKLVINQDGFSWDVALEEEFPVQFGWWVSRLTGGPGGLAAIFEGWDQSETRTAPPRPTLTRGDRTLTVDYLNGRIVVETPTTTATYDMHNVNNSALFDIDMVAGSISFLQPGTDIVHMTVSIDDLIELESSASWSQPQGRHSALVHSRDAVEWSIHDVATELGADVFIDSVALTEDEIIVTARRGADPVFGPSGTTSDIEIWTAPLP